MSELQFFSRNDSLYAEKSNGTRVNYFIFKDSEIHYNEISPHSVQEWHSHSIVDEAILVTSGTLLCRYLADDAEKQIYVRKGDLVKVSQSIHTFENDTDDTAEFAVFRYIPSDTDKRELIRSDKKLFCR